MDCFAIGQKFFKEIIGHLWAELLSTGSGDPGLRGGARVELGASEISASIYGFGASFPDLAPMYRPDERGVQFAGRFRPGSAWSLFGSLDYVADSPVERRERFRGDAGVGWRPAAHWPYLQMTYYRSREPHRDGSTYRTLPHPRALPGRTGRPRAPIRPGR